MLIIKRIFKCAVRDHYLVIISFLFYEKTNYELKILPSRVLMNISLGFS